MLKEHLAVRKELTRRTQAASEDWRERMEDAEKTLDDQKSTHVSVNADISRQYKTMQHEMGLRNTLLDMDVQKLTGNLAITQDELQTTQRSMKKMCEEKDDEISILRLKIDSMGTQYETVLMDNLDRLVDKMDTMRSQWEETTLNIHDYNKERLLEFGFNPLEF
ncbi:hypothetical protein NP493_463g02050 [Ridgeia piscesae]|uniref:Dynein regulatory complex protein 12 n=1 Tax=Ridgeia piscesae TaxID=27915 RepID=A0AAD9KYM8_RIDPI|nr:hypothetical protein NP493_463g02050 [Ridgeia piscesae]